MAFNKRLINQASLVVIQLLLLSGAAKLRADEQKSQKQQIAQNSSLAQSTATLNVDAYLSKNHRQSWQFLNKILAAAVKDAGQPEADKRFTNLVALSPNNTNEKIRWRNNNGKIEFLMSNWISEKLARTLQSEVGKNFTLDKNRHYWLTASPQVKEFCSNCKGSGLKIPGLVMLNLRVQQYLGLKLDANKTHFVEMWVKQEDLMRPCIDKEIDDSACEVLPKTIPANQIDLVNIKKETEGYPWTGLGYTYDWGISQKPHLGASEFVTRKGTEQTPVEVEIAAVTTTEDYCGNKFLTGKTSLGKRLE